MRHESRNVKHTLLASGLTIVSGCLLAVWFGIDWGAVLIYGILLGLPSGAILFSFADMFVFLRNPRISRRRDLPEVIEPPLPSNGPGREPRRLDPRVQSSPWFHTRWIGPGGYK